MRVASPDLNSEASSEEHRLIVRAQGGDRPAFAELVERYWNRLYRWLYHLAHDRHAAEDLAQETFLKAFAGLRKFRPGTNFGAWLFRIGHNNFANHYRATRRREALPDDLPARGHGPEAEAQGHETQQALAQAVKRLPTDFRAALLLRAEEGLSFRQIADVLGLTEETARWRVFKARQKLLAVLAPEPLRPRLGGNGEEQEKP
jgi:RNA polymerase sigma-70 factor (ECF subfamily)